MSELDLAIDIHLKKLLDWLVSRRLCNREWHQRVLPIREKIGHAIQDMPEHPKITRLLTGASINYFHCLQIVEILKETEADTKNFFGSYGSQRMKDWQEVASLYKRESVYLAEGAQLLSQACTYEIPGLKKSLAKSIAVQEESEKKEKENARRAKEFRAEFKKSCEQLGIKGEKLRKEVISLLDGLPDTYASIAEESKGLRAAREAYQGFLRSTLEMEGEGETPLEVLPTLRFLMEKGNVTTYEWVHGEVPLSVEEPRLDFGDEDEDDKQVDVDGGIDFGDDDDAGAGGIDFGDGGEADGGDIDWGNLDSGEAQVEIDWGASGAVDDVDTSAIVVEDGGVAGGVARDSDALSLLDNRRTRTLILDELEELRCFLLQRLAEAEAAEDGALTGLAMSSLSGGGGSGLEPSQLKKMASSTEALMGRLNTGQVHHLQLIRSSPKYVDRLVDTLKQKLSLEARMVAANEALAKRKDDAIKEQAEVQKKLEVVREKTTELQKHLEDDISERYKGRPVNIMGGIQSV